ncbi:MAG: NAD(P)-binding domain-containing protein, partial [Opitutales bacterium]
MGNASDEARGKAVAVAENKSFRAKPAPFLVCHACPRGFALAPLMQSDIGLIGLAVMGQNLALNIADHGFAIS